MLEDSNTNARGLNLIWRKEKHPCEYGSGGEHNYSSSESKAWKKFRPVGDFNAWHLRYRCRKSIPCRLQSSFMKLEPVKTSARWAYVLTRWLLLPTMMIMSEGLTQSAVLSNPSSNGNNCALTQPTTWKTIVEVVQTKGPQKPKLSKISCFPISNHNFSLSLPLCILLHSLISQSRQRTLALAWETDVDIFCVILLFVFTEFS